MRNKIRQGPRVSNFPGSSLKIKLRGFFSPVGNFGSFAKTPADFKGRCVTAVVLTLYGITRRMAWDIIASLIEDKPGAYKS